MKQIQCTHTGGASRPLGQGSWGGRLLACLLSLILLPQAWPQEEEGSDEIYELSPFVIEASDSVGYSATNTIAGTRLKTPLKDIGAAVSVITGQMLEDLGADGSQDLLQYAAGTEVGGLQGNFAGGTIASERPNQDGARAKPEDNQRVRGLARAELTRDYFLSDIPFDSYNTERVTISRGPNALLFGIGSPGGVINNATVKPLFGRDLSEVTIRYGQHGSWRQTIDFNRELLEGRLAVRVAGLNNEVKYRQEPAFKDDRRLFGAATLVLREGLGDGFLGRSAFRLNAETIDIDSNPPNVTPPNDAFSDWWSPPQAEPVLPFVRELPDWWTDGTFYPQFTVNNREGNGALSIPEGRSEGERQVYYFIQMNLPYAKATEGAGPSFGGTDPALRDLEGGVGRIRWNVTSVDRPQVNQFITQSAWRRLSGFNVHSIQDRQVFDYVNKMLAGTTNSNERDFEAYNLAFEQELFSGRAGFEVSFDSQESERRTQFPFGGGFSAGAGMSDLAVDISEWTSNDRPNPNLGRLVARTFNWDDNFERIERDAFRATAYATLDGADLFGGDAAQFWFGRHTLTGFYSDQRIDSFGTTHNLGIDSDSIDAESLFFAKIDGFRRSIPMTAYVSDSLMSVSDPSDVRITETMDIRLPRHGDGITGFYLDRFDTESIQVGEFFVRRFLDGGSVGRRDIESKAVSLQSYFLDEHVIGILGYREDSQDVFDRINRDNDADPDTSDRLPDGEFDRSAIVLDDDPVDIADGDTVTASLMLVYPESWLGELPFGADLRAFYNESENFNPVGVRRNVFNESIAPPEGSTEEYGLVLSLLEGKLSGRFNVFETRASNFTFGALSGAARNSSERVTSWLNLWYQASLEGVPLEETGATEAGFSSYDEVFAEIVGFLPESVRAQVNPRIEDGRVLSDPIANPVATTSFAAEGWEFELTGNPSKSIRFAFNIAKQETTLSDIAPDLGRLNAEMLQRIESSPLGQVPDAPGLGEAGTFISRYRGLVNAPLNTERAKEGTISQEQREWRANGLLSYAFREGPLSGSTIGGALRYQSGAAVGYPRFLNETDDWVPDLSRPYKTDDEVNGDFWISHERRIFNDRADWKVQINVRNAIGAEDAIPLSINPDGSVAIIRVGPQTEWFITNTFRF